MTRGQETCPSRAPLLGRSRETEGSNEQEATRVLSSRLLMRKTFAFRLVLTLGDQSVRLVDAGHVGVRDARAARRHFLGARGSHRPKGVASRPQQTHAAAIDDLGVPVAERSRQGPRGTTI